MILLLLGSIGLILFAGLAALLARSRPALAGALGAGGAAAGGVAGFAVSLVALVGGREELATASWNTGLGASLSVGVDPLSAFFLLPIFGLTALAAVYGSGYLRPKTEGKRAGSAWLCYDLLAASMAVAVLARNAVLFLVAWEVMTLSSWLLVVYDREREETRRAGVIYLVASQIGTAALMVMFLILGSSGGPAAAEVAGLDFARFAPAAAGTASAVFVLAMIGFGTKAGFVPLHVWLPEAHPAAPSHVSALMSGVMIKMGIYGLVRVLSFLGAPRLWWGWTVLAVGVVSALLGVLFALAQHDLKRLLAYHSVENVGIIAMGIGLGMLGSAYGLPAVSFLGWAGGLLHVVNHAAFKGLLFLGAGSVQHAARTRELDSLGGLARRMPVSAATFLVGAAAISGLPPLNGFVSEFLIFFGALASARSVPLAPAILAAVVIVALGMVGGLAAACFSKAFGIVFLGEPRSEEAKGAHESPVALLVPMAILAASCVGIGLLGGPLVRAVSGVAATAAGLHQAGAALALDGVTGPLAAITLGFGLFLGLAGSLALARFLLLRGRSRRSSVTWDCGYAAPTSRMQYTASSFAQPILGMFRLLLQPHRKVPEIRESFPKEAEFHSETRDLFGERVYRPGIGLAMRLFAPFRRLQHGNLHLYVLYIVVALLALAVWKLG
jgi:hydrogenase-4 component B